ELARTPVAVISAGAKSILDLPKTLEVLETQGVPVIGYRTATFPAFYARACDLPVPVQVDDVVQLAAMLKTQWSLDYPGGALIANPIPEAAAIPAAEIQAAIDQALAEARQHNITGKPVTPFLLARISELTGGHSLEANIALVRNNVRLGTELALALGQAQKGAEIDNQKKSALHY
ncbi:MAG: pseudouridine-5'-phosphate glycosidase, partial [Pseudomonadota bacterium]